MKISATIDAKALTANAKDDVEAATNFFDKDQKAKVVTKVDDAALKAKDREISKLNMQLDSIKKQ